MGGNRFHHIAFCLLIAFHFIAGHAQDTAGSDIVSRAFLSSDCTKAIEHRVYDNGLGDVVQEVESCYGSDLPDVVVHHEYDSHRRRTRTWLPVAAASGGGYVSGSSISSLAVSRYSDSAPYSRTEYDGFLLSEPSSHYKAGVEWQGGNRKVSVSYSEYVGAAMLYDYELFRCSDIKFLCTRRVDENSCPYAEYTDMNGRLMMTETSQGRTYYVYNDKGDIVYVLPPSLTEHILSSYEDGESVPDTDEMMQKYAYIYRYDNQRHCIYRKLPGCEPIYHVYDRTGNRILTQDGEQRQDGVWAYDIPDRFGRPCIRGICHNSINHSTEPLHSVHVYADYDGTATQTGGYTVNNLTLSSQTLYSAAYYDGYSFIGHHGVPSSLAASDVPGYTIDASLGRGLQTGSAVAVFGDGDVTGYAYSAMYYDSRHNVSQVKSTNHLNGSDVTCTSYSYTGKPLGTKHQHTSAQTTVLEEEYTYSYDPADRLQNVSHKTGSGYLALLRGNIYNGLGQLVETRRSFTGGMHSTEYEYDLHSWLTRIDAGSLFRERLLYADSDSPSYNGNISVMEWVTAGSLNVTRRYGFRYDNASRLASADYSEGSGGSNKYGTSYQYDRMGNVTTLRRKGLQDGGTYGYVDNLTLNYDGNRLASVTDAVSDPTYSNAWNFTDGASLTVEYEYDGNGNMTKDLNKGITSIEYNPVNLPEKVTFSGGREIRYTYTADGRKLRAVYTTTLPATTHTTDYCGNIIYENGSISQLLVDGGYVTFAGGNSSGSPVYHYYMKDHLGNNRVVVNKNGTIEQVTHYYPYGGLMAESTSQSVQRHKYNGKELDRMHGLDCYDYGARWSNSHLGSWTTMDPMCEKYYDISPYAYCKGNPVRFIDPDGEKPTASEAARMAAHVYGDKKDNILTGGWTVSKRDFGKNVYLVTGSGLKSAVYERTIGGKKEYVYATAGTQMDSEKDWEANLLQPLGLSAQYREAAENAKKISDAVGKSEELTYVGHSLGGGEAALNSLVTSEEGLPGRGAITFNAATVFSMTKAVNGSILTPFKSEKKITAYVMATDPLNKLISPANGVIVTLWPKDWDSITNGHIIDNILKCFGVNQQLK